MDGPRNQRMNKEDTLQLCNRFRQTDLKRSAQCTHCTRKKTQGNPLPPPPLCPRVLPHCRGRYSSDMRTLIYNSSGRFSYTRQTGTRARDGCTADDVRRSTAADSSIIEPYNDDDDDNGRAADTRRSKMTGTYSRGCLPVRRSSVVSAAAAADHPRRVTDLGQL